jgi:hypothetical protein
LMRMIPAFPAGTVRPHFKHRTCQPGAKSFIG